MKTTNSNPLTRRSFLQASTGLVSGLPFLPEIPFGDSYAPPASIHIIGPIEGYAAQVGTMLSMLNWMSDSVVRATQKLTTAELDYMHDNKANTIGSLLMHLAATEVIYQDLTFANRQDFSDENKKKWGVAMNLGDEARKQIKGNSFDYYLTALNEVRAKTATEFKQRDDAWIMKVDPQFFGNQPTNNYCKWFHVAEHIGNHRGQITWTQKRLPGAKPTRD